MPQALLQQDPSLLNCLALLRAVWQTQHRQVYQILRERNWPDSLQPLVKRYESMFTMLCLFTSQKLILANRLSIGFFQDKTLIAVSRSYEAIRLATAANHLGLDEQLAEREDPNVISNFTKCGWTWDPETKLLYPKPIVVLPADNQSSNGIRDAMAMLGTRGS